MLMLVNSRLFLPAPDLNTRIVKTIYILKNSLYIYIDPQEWRKRRRRRRRRLEGLHTFAGDPMLPEVMHRNEVISTV